jgi:hypothetical protein
MAQLTGYAPINPLAFEIIEDSTAKKLPSYPENFEVQVSYNNDWWIQFRSDWVEQCTEALLD